MNQKYQTIVEILKQKNKTISTMESCTGGSLANTITNIPGASEVFYFGAVTYSNQYKIKMGVNPDTIKQYSVYSMETAKEMSYHISQFTNSDYGIAITGKLNRVDKANLYGSDNTVYISIYDKEKETYYTASMEVTKNDRIQNKQAILENIASLLLLYIKT